MVRSTAGDLFGGDTEEEEVVMNFMLLVPLASSPAVAPCARH
jgi:hypothetical protein